MRLKRSNAGARVCMLALLVVLSASALTVTPALALPEGRVYEMVSPPYKGGYGVLGLEAVAPDGESVAYYSPGGFAKAPSGPELSDYIARRGASGWTTAPLMAPATLMSVVFNRDVSSTLDLMLAVGKPGPNNEGAFHMGAEEEFRVHPTDAEDVSAQWEPAGPVLTAANGASVTASYIGASSDLCHLFVDTSRVPLLPEALPEALESTDPAGLVYELDRGCGGEPESVRLLGLNNSHKVINSACGVGMGSQGSAYAGGTIQLSRFNATSADGGEVFFESGVGVGNVCIPIHHQLFVRLDGARTLEVSRPLEASEFGGCVGEVGGAPGEVPCAGAASRASANFVGASEDGSRVFFATQAPLVSEDGDTKNDLYMARIGCPQGKPGCGVAEREVTSLVQVSHDPTLGKAAEVQGFVRVASDGSRVYFVAHGDLLSAGERAALEGEGRAVPRVGADNLYVYDTSGSVAFIADLCSGPELSGGVEEHGELKGAAEDLQCPNNLEKGSAKRNDTGLWGPNPGEAQTNSCRPAHPSCEPGRFLLFSTYARLSVGDTDEAKDVYRYDADTGTLERVSVGEGGYHANGNCEGGGSESKCDSTIARGHWGGYVRDQYEMGSRAISEDGSRIVFTTAEPLSPAASNGQANVYEWDKQPGQSEGRVSMVSSGSGEPVEHVVISPEGNDIFFVTTQGLVAQDTDGAPDIYDARLNGGFLPPSGPAESCEGDACQGPLTNPAPLLIPGSVSQAPGGNFAAPKTPVPSKTKSKAKRKPTKKRSRASTGKRKAKAKRAGRVKAAKLGRGRS
jgi:hypothetical protein